MYRTSKHPVIALKPYNEHIIMLKGSSLISENIQSLLLLPFLGFTSLIVGMYVHYICMCTHVCLCLHVHM